MTNRISQCVLFEKLPLCLFGSNLLMQDSGNHDNDDDDDIFAYTIVYEHMRT